MSVSNFKANQSQKAEFENIVLDEGLYQCSIDKIEVVERTKYMSSDKENQLLLRLSPLNVDKKFEDKVLFYNTTLSFFNGKSSKADSALKPSKLYLLIKTVYKFYHPEINVDEMEAEEITDEVINGLEGKQIMAMVKLNEKGNNKVTDMMSIKTEIAVTSNQGVSQDELDKVLGIA